MYKRAVDISLEDFVHIRTKSMYAGAREVILKKALIHDGSAFSNEPFPHSPCYYHCVNEIIVNAFDNLIKGYDAPKDHGGRCNLISVNISKDNITVFNDGMGIDVLERKHTDGKTYWNPCLIVSKLMTGSNLTTKDNTVGGTNGFGMKLTFYYSNTFAVTTYDAYRKRLYTQSFWCDIKGDPNTRVTFGEPQITSEEYFKGTLFSFKLDHEYLGYKSLKDSDIAHLTSYVRALLILLRNHVESFGYQVEVLLNGSILDLGLTHSAKSMCNGVSLVQKAELGKISMTIYLGTELNFSMVNNLVGVSDKDSTHIMMIRTFINNKLKASLSKFCTQNGLTAYSIKKLFGNITFSVSAKIPNISPSSQRKELIEFSEASFKFDISDSFLKQVYTEVTSKLATIQPPKLKLEKPEYIKFKNCSSPYLIITEGKHASSMIDTMLNYMNRGKYSVFEIQGVPINSYKNITTREGKLVFSNKFKKLDKKSGKVSNRLLMLQTILGFTTGQTDFTKSTYKGIIIATDNDEDGKGNIFMMLILFFYRMWPKLFDIPFISRLETPLIRLYKKTHGGSPQLFKKLDLGKTEFFSEVDYNEYLIEHFKSLPDYQAISLDDIKTLINQCFDVRYYKGLGSHSKEEIQSIAKTFNDNLLYYRLSQRTLLLFDILWGEDTSKRKALLSNVPPRKRPAIKVINGIKWVSVADHIMNEALHYHLLKITRALPSWEDGLTISRRKILYYALTKLTVGKAVDVTSISGNVKASMDYHHGEASLEGSIILMSQTFKGSNTINLLLGRGVYGSLLDGVKSQIQARYVKTELTKAASLIFPKEDMPLYSYNYFESKLEPVVMVPIIPLAVLENRHVPGTGWKHQSWSRSVKVVLAFVKILIKRGTLNGRTLWGYMESQHGYYIKGNKEAEPVIFRKVGNKLVITELPVGVYINPFISKLPEGCTADNLTNDSGLKIEVTGLDPDHPILEAKLDTFLNFTAKEGIRSYDSYEDVVSSWFEVRRDLYILRKERLIKVLDIKILRVSNIIKFLQVWEDLGLNYLSEDQKWKVALEPFDKIDITLMHGAKDPSIALIDGDHQYLKQLNVRSIGVKAVSRYQKELESLQKELEELKQTTWQQMWLSELAQLEGLLI